MQLSLRKAILSDKDRLENLILRSALELQNNTYSHQQIRAAIGSVFGVDQQMIQDGTYYVVEYENDLVGCGGWSFREALFGGRPASKNEPRRLDPHTDPARVRAFFVDPVFARQGIASLIMEVCEEAILDHGFSQSEISATLVGEPLYKKFGYTSIGYYEIGLTGAPAMKVARMFKEY